MKEISDELYREIDREMSGTWMSLVPRRPLPDQTFGRANIQKPVPVQPGCSVTFINWTVYRDSWTWKDRATMIRSLPLIWWQRDLSALSAMIETEEPDVMTAMDGYRRSGGNEGFIWIPNGDSLLLFSRQIMRRNHLPEARYWWWTIYEEESGYRAELAAGYEPLLYQLGRRVRFV